MTKLITADRPWAMLAGRSESVMTAYLREHNLRLDALISDPAYSPKTHTGNAAASYGDGNKRRVLDYPPMTPARVRAFVRVWSPLTRGWFCILTDHVLVPTWERALEREGRYVFANVPVIIPGMTVRATGDGHSTECVHLVAARPRTREFAKWGTLRGFYQSKGRDGWSAQLGGKPLDVMGAIIRDHSREGDLVGDPWAGGGTTILQAVVDGRRGLGCELDAGLSKVADDAITAHATPNLLTRIAAARDVREAGQQLRDATQSALWAQETT